jgi:hypothetical protein
MRIPDAGWSSPVARWAHNPKVAGSNPAPATKSSEGLCPSDSPTVSLARRFAASLRSPDSLAALARSEWGFVGAPTRISSRQSLGFLLSWVMRHARAGLLRNIPTAAATVAICLPLSGKTTAFTPRDVAILITAERTMVNVAQVGQWCESAPLAVMEHTSCCGYCHTCCP